VNGQLVMMPGLLGKLEDVGVGWGTSVSDGVESIELAGSPLPRGKANNHANDDVHHWGGDSPSYGPSWGHETVSTCGSELATTDGNRAISPRQYKSGHRPLKADTRVRILLEPPP
jgi:hypothetical protein